MSGIVEKLRVARSAFHNWPRVVPDRLRWYRAPTIEYRLRNGRRMLCRPGTTDSGEVAVVCAGVEYPRAMVDALRYRLNPVVFDLGANIGGFSVWLDAALEGISYRAYAFEPMPANMALLRANLAANQVSRVTPVQSCVGGWDGQVCLDTTQNFDAVRIARDGNGSLEVPCVKLSTFARAHAVDRVDLLKVDIEGAEFELIEADLDYIQAAVGSFMIEVHEEKEPRTEHRLRALLETKFQLGRAGLRGNILVGTRR